METRLSTITIIWAALSFLNFGKVRTRHIAYENTALKDDLKPKSSLWPVEQSPPVHNGGRASEQGISNKDSWTQDYSSPAQSDGKIEGFSPVGNFRRIAFEALLSGQFRELEEMVDDLHRELRDLEKNSISNIQKRSEFVAKLVQRVVADTVRRSGNIEDLFGEQYGSGDEGDGEQERDSLPNISQEGHGKPSPESSQIKTRSFEEAAHMKSDDQLPADEGEAKKDISYPLGDVRDELVQLRNHAQFIRRQLKDMQVAQQLPTSSDQAQGTPDAGHSGFDENIKKSARGKEAEDVMTNDQGASSKLGTQDDSFGIASRYIEPPSPLLVLGDSTGGKAEPIELDESEKLDLIDEFEGLKMAAKRLAERVVQLQRDLRYVNKFTLV